MNDTSLDPTADSPGYLFNDEIKAGGDTNDPINFAISLDELIEEENTTGFVDEQGQVVPTPQNIDERSVSGHMPDPNSDDDIDEVAHKVGLHTDERDEEPEELDLAQEISEAEKAHRHGN